MTKVPVFAEMSYTTTSLNIHDSKASFHDKEHSALVGFKVYDTSICENDSLQPEITIQVLDESYHGIKFREVRSIAPRVPLLVPFDGPKFIRPIEHLEQDMSTRYVDVNSPASGSPNWKTDLESIVDWYLADIFMEPMGDENMYLNISTSSMNSVKILPDTENGKSTEAFNDQNILSQFLLVPASNLFIVTIHVIVMDLCVWDPGICFDFMSLRDFTQNTEVSLLLGCTRKFFLKADFNSSSGVWDPGKAWCMHCYLSNWFSVIYNYIAFTYPSIAYELVVDENYDVNHDVLVANFRQTSILRLEVNTRLDYKSEINYTMLARKNHFALLSSTIRLPNLHARFNVLPIGITDLMIFFGKHSVEHVVLSMSAHHWSFKICVHGFLPNVFIGRNYWFVYVVINGDAGVLHDFNYVAVKGIGAIVSSLLTVCILQILYQDNASFMYNLVFGEGVQNDILYLSSLEFILFVIKRFIEKFPLDERCFLTVVDQAKFCKLLDDMEQVASNLKYAHFKDNWKHLYYISLLPLAYFVRSSIRIIHLNKCVSGQRLRDNVKMPRHNNVSWRGNSGLQDGEYIDLIMLKYLVVVYDDAGDGLQLSLPLFCVLTMLSWSVSEHLTNYEVVVELDHVRVGNKEAFIMMSILRILWPRGHLEKLQDFSCHNHVQQEVNYVDTIYKAWYEALDFFHKELAGDFSHKKLASACHQMHFMHLEVTVTTPRLPTLLLVRFPDLNLEDKVLIEDGSIVMNQPQPNKDIAQIDIEPSRPNKRNKAMPSQRIIWDPD